MDNDRKFFFPFPNIPWPFPWPWKRDDGENDGKVINKDGFDPVLFIPGIGGSILEAVSDDGKRERVWVRLLNADHEFRTKLWSKYDPATGNILQPCRDVLHAMGMTDTHTMLGRKCLLRLLCLHRGLLVDGPIHLYMRFSVVRYPAWLNFSTI